jgi:hypothetical protein
MKTRLLVSMFAVVLTAFQVAMTLGAAYGLGQITA